MKSVEKKKVIINQSQSCVADDQNDRADRNDRNDRYDRNDRSE